MKGTRSKAVFLLLGLLLGLNFSMVIDNPELSEYSNVELIQEVSNRELSEEELDRIIQGDVDPVNENNDAEYVVPRSAMYVLIGLMFIIVILVVEFLLGDNIRSKIRKYQSRD